MGGNKNTGFTKAAQKEKFIRNRDIKLKGSEIRKEEKIQRLMCEGICPKCREKVQWRFKFDKYKPLKNAATCQNCHQKTIAKAYRTLCDMCSSQRKCCASCCGDLFSAVVADRNADADYPDQSVDENDPQSADKDEELSPTSSCNQSALAVTAAVDLTVIDAPLNSTVSDESLTSAADDWDTKKFYSMASHKYSKHRVVGSEEDRSFAFGFSEQMSKGKVDGSVVVGSYAAVDISETPEGAV